MNLLNDPRIKQNEAAVVQRFTRSIPVKVGELAVQLGLKVSRTPMPPKISGLIRPSNDASAGFEIKVNKYEVQERQRFTVAHEIAHYLLHRDEIGTEIVDSIMYRSTLTSRKETEANQLAADIVMPASIVNDEFEKRGGKATEDVVAEMADIFRVSASAMKIRLGVA